MKVLAHYLVRFSFRFLIETGAVAASLVSSDGSQTFLSAHIESENVMKISVVV